jgi:hypothetical protein
MEVNISRERFELALERLGQGEWEQFERLCSAYLASEWPSLRTIASPTDEGRDSELFAPVVDSTVAIQYSVQKTWDAKIRRTLIRLKETKPNLTVLVFMTNQQIGARGDAAKKSAMGQGIFLDIRDRSWFIDRLHTDPNREKSANHLARAIVDPLLEKRGILTQARGGLSGQDARTALIFLEMQGYAESRAKGLTRSCFEALVRAALLGSNDTKRIKRTELYTQIAKYLPRHSSTVLAPYIDASLKRLAKIAIRSSPSTDEFWLSYEETERIKDSASRLQLLDDTLRQDIRDIVTSAEGVAIADEEAFITLTRATIEAYFLRRGEEFASAVSRGLDVPLHFDDLRSAAFEQSAKTPVTILGRQPIAFLLTVVESVLSHPGEGAAAYLKLISDSYTLFAFLSETPDVQKVTKKLFSYGEIWLDTSVMLPIFAEQAYPDKMRPFSAMFEQARAVGAKLIVSPGFIQEIERHLNLCLTYARTTVPWRGRVPFVYSRYALAGRAASGFAGWLEQFRGDSRPEQDLAEYVYDEFGIEVREPKLQSDMPTDLRNGIKEFWLQVHDKRRRQGDSFDFAVNRLAEHDAECYMAVLEQRLVDRTKSPLGYTSWWLTLDSAALEIKAKIGSDISRHIEHSPVLSVDFLLKYLAFGPNRSLVVTNSGNSPPLALAGLFESLPPELLKVAQETREKCGQLPERVIQRRIRDQLDYEKMNVGSIHKAGLEASEEAIAAIF